MPVRSRRLNRQSPALLASRLASSCSVSLAVGLAVGLAVSFSAGGCAPIKDVALAAQKSAGNSFDRITGKSLNDPVLDFETSGPIEIDVDLFAGNVEIYADPDHRGTTVQITRRAEFGAGRKDAAEASLSDLDIVADVVPGQLGQKLIVTARSNADESAMQSVDLVIKTGEIKHLTVSTGKGSITSRNAAGRITARTERGDIRITTSEVINNDVDIETSEGGIAFRVPAGSGAQLDFAAENGKVFQTVRSGRMVIAGRTTDRRLNAVLNDGENTFRLRSTAGNIRFGVVDRPNATGTFIVE